MKRKVILTLWCLMVIGFISAAQTTNDSLRVLFIGNSITYVNNMPFMFRDIANNKHINTSVTMYAPGGSGIVNHYVDPNVYSLFRNNVWDVLILQPGSGESAGASWPVDTTISRSRILLDSLYTYSPCANVFLYQIPYGVPSSTTWSTYFSVQTMILDSVSKMADSLHLQMIPAGECCRAYYNMHQDLLLHSSYNDIHPSAFGSFMVASACFASVFQDSVSGCTYYASLPPDTARLFFKITDSIVPGNYPAWNINTFNLHAAFSSSVNGNVVTFINSSSNYTAAVWDFGDNSTSALPNPIHTYTTNGVYTVTLIAKNASCADSCFEKITVVMTDVAETIKNDPIFSFSPNPFSQTARISFSPGQTIGNIALEIYNLQGQLVATNHYTDCSNIILQRNGLCEGMYFLKLTLDGKRVETRKVVITD